MPVFDNPENFILADVLSTSIRTKLTDSILLGQQNAADIAVLGPFTKAQLDTAVSDGNVQYVGDAPTSHTHLLAAGATDVTMTAANLNTLDDGVNTTLHFHTADRARANHTGTQLAATISDFDSAVTSASLVQGVDGSFLTDASGTARGPYALPVNPVDSRTMTLQVNGLHQQSPSMYTIVVMGAAPSGFGVLFVDDQPLSATVTYRIAVPKAAAVVGDAFRTGNGSPEGAVTADQGTLYLQRDGRIDETLWVKNAGTGSTSWVPNRHKYRSRSAPTTYVTATTISKEVGNATAATNAQFTRVALGAGAAAFDVTVELSLTNAEQGDFFDFYINLPSLVDRRLIFVSGTVAGGGTVLATMFNAASARYGARFVYNGAVWQAAWINQSLFM